MLKIYIGEELVVEGGEKGLDVGFVEAGAFEDDDRAIGEVGMAASRIRQPLSLLLLR